MPVDTKRLPVPEKSVPYQLHYAAEAPKSLLDSKGIRRDGRKPAEARPIFVKTRAVSRAKGSAYVEVGPTKVVCSVFGPREIAKREDFSMTGSLCCEFKFATFSEPCRRAHQQDGQEKDYSLLLQEILQPSVLLHTFPKCQVDVNVLVLENGGGALAAAITGASIALVEAGIQTYDVVLGSSLVVVAQPSPSPQPSLSLVDPSFLEESVIEDASSEHGRLVVAYMPSLKQVAGFHQTGVMSLERIHEGIETCLSAAEKILPLVRKKIAESLDGGPKK